MFELSHIGGSQSKLYKKIHLSKKQNAPCRNMQLLADDKELWFSCGNTIVVANLGHASGSLSIDIIHEFLVVVNTTAIVSSMKYHSGFLWCSVIDSCIDNTCQIVKIDASSKECVGRIELKGNEVVGDNIGIETGIDKLESPAGVHTISTAGEIEDNSAIHVLCVQVTDSILWISTAKGTVVVVDTSESNFGDVIGIFSLVSSGHLSRRSVVNGDTDGPVRHLSLIGNDKLIACQEVKGTTSEKKVLGRQLSGCSKYRLVVWDRWTVDRFRWFEQVRQPLSP